MNNLGWMLKATGGDSAECVSLLRAALLVQREVLGFEHPDTLTSINKLGLILQDQGEAAEAAQLCSEALAARRTTLGDRHPGTLLAACSLGSLLLEIGDLPQAVGLFRWAHDGARETLGDEHAYTRSFSQHLTMASRMVVAKHQHQQQSAAADAQSTGSVATTPGAAAPHGLALAAT